MLVVRTSPKVKRLSIFLASLLFGYNSDRTKPQYGPCPGIGLGIETEDLNEAYLYLLLTYYDYLENFVVNLLFRILHRLTL